MDTLIITIQLFVLSPTGPALLCYANKQGLLQDYTDSYRAQSQGDD